MDGIKGDCRKYQKIIANMLENSYDVHLPDDTIVFLREHEINCSGCHEYREKLEKGTHEITEFVMDSNGPDIYDFIYSKEDDAAYERIVNDIKEGKLLVKKLPEDLERISKNMFSTSHYWLDVIKKINDNLFD